MTLYSSKEISKSPLQGADTP